MESKQLRFWSLRWSVSSADLANAEKLQAFLPTIFDKFIFQLENSRPLVEGKVCDNYHYQGYAHSASSTRKFTLARAFNANGFSGLEVSPASTAGITALQKYTMKFDTYVAGPWSEAGLLHVEKPYDGADLAYIADHPYPWQSYFIEMFAGSPDPRKIIWVYDPHGNTGKSEFVKFCAFHYGANFLGWSKYSDVANLVNGAERKSIFLFDLVRTKPKDVSAGDLYSAIESIKSGLINNTKYQAKNIFFARPHVLVFSNSLPDYSKLSRDRWCVMTMTPEKRLVTYEEEVVKEKPLEVFRIGKRKRDEVDEVHDPVDEEIPDPESRSHSAYKEEVLRTWAAYAAYLRTSPWR